MIADDYVVGQGAPGAVGLGHAHDRGPPLPERVPQTVEGAVEHESHQAVPLGHLLERGDADAMLGLPFS